MPLKKIFLQVIGRDADNKMHDAVFRYLIVKENWAQKIPIYSLVPGPAWLVDLKYNTLQYDCGCLGHVHLEYLN